MPVPLAALTPDHLRGMMQVHAFDPDGPGLDAWLPVPGRPRPPGEPLPVLDVHISRTRAAADLATLRRIIAATTGAARDVLPVDQPEPRVGPAQM